MSQSRQGEMSLHRAWDGEVQLCVSCQSQPRPRGPKQMRPPQEHQLTSLSPLTHLTPLPGGRHPPTNPPCAGPDPGDPAEPQSLTPTT